MRTYRASALGYSLEALVAPHLGFEPVAPPEFIQNAWDEGSRIESLAIQKLWDMGWTVNERQKEINKVGDYQIEVELEVIPGIAEVVGHLDGTGFPNGGVEGVVEVKMMAAQAWRSFEKHGWDAPGLVQKYKWQQSAYMLGSGLGVHYMVAWNKETEELAFAVSTEPFYTIADIANKLQECEDAIAAGEIPSGCTDFPCPYFYLHPPKEDVAIPASSALELAMDEWLIWDKAVKEAEKKRASLREAIIGLVGVDGETVAVAKVKGSNGVSVETYWQKGSEYMVKKKEGWVTRVSGPRGKNA